MIDVIILSTLKEKASNHNWIYARTNRETSEEEDKEPEEEVQETKQHTNQPEIIKPRYDEVVEGVHKTKKNKVRRSDEISAEMLKNGEHIQWKNLHVLIEKI